MQAETEVRSRYLALALDARKIIDRLMNYYETGESTGLLMESVLEAAQSLQSIVDPAQFSHPSVSRLAFEHYEQVVTLEQVRRWKDQEDVIKDLYAVLQPVGDPNEKKDAAYRAIQFFFEVETRALQYYARPPIVQGLDELSACRST